MLPGFKSFKIYRGDTFSFRMTLNTSEDAYPIGDHEFAGEIKERGKDAVVATLAFDIENEEDGVLRVTLTPTESKKLIAGRKYVYDIEMTNPSGDVSTLIEGPILVTGDTTA